MPYAIDQLMKEHRLIEEVLSSLAGFASKVRNGRPATRETLRQYVDFFSRYADRVHHGKEEDILFTRMIERGVPSQMGPLAVMYAEHDQGRTEVGALRALGQGDAELSPADRERIYAHASAYIDLLGNHITKEDRVLYPMAIRILPSDDWELLTRRFEATTGDPVEAATQQELRHLAGEILRANPPAWPSGGAGCSACAGCGAEG